MRTYKIIVEPKHQIDEYEYYNSTIQQLSKTNISILVEWEKTLNERMKNKFTNLLKMRRVEVINCNDSGLNIHIKNVTEKNKSMDTDLNKNIEKLDSLSLGTVPRKIMKIKRNNMNFVEIDSNNNNKSNLTD